MRSLRRTSLSGCVAAAVAAGLVLSSCGGGSSPAPGTPSGGTPSLEPGATRVTGTERLAWGQLGDVPNLRYVVYVGDTPVALDAAACNDAMPEAECTSPLPPLSDGVHTIAVVAVSVVSGAESDRSSVITVQKVSAGSVVSAATLPDAWPSTGRPGEAVTVRIADGHTFAADVVARGLHRSVQLAASPDGRLLVSHPDGRVTVVRPGASQGGVVALDARAFLRPGPVGSMGLALHPDFARNRFVYLSFLARDGAEATRLHVVRLRESGETLGEPARIFEAPVVIAAEAAPADSSRGKPDATGMVPGAGPLSAFGPDGLLHVLLPSGAQVDDARAASQPLGAMVRLDADGRVPDAGPLSGIVAHPLGFVWHPASAALLAVFPGASDLAELRAISAPALGVRQATGAPPVLMANRDAISGALTVQSVDASAVSLARAFVEGIDRGTMGAIRLAAPIQMDDTSSGLSGLVLDAVSDGAGTIYLVMIDASSLLQGGDGAAVVVRLRPGM